MKTFRAADGRRVRKNEDTIRNEIVMCIASLLAPIVMTIVFFFAAGIQL